MNNQGQLRAAYELVQGDQSNRAADKGKDEGNKVPLMNFKKDCMDEVADEESAPSKKVAHYDRRHFFTDQEKEQQKSNPLVSKKGKANSYQMFPSIDELYQMPEERPIGTNTYNNQDGVDMFRIQNYSDNQTKTLKGVQIN